MTQGLFGKTRKTQALYGKCSTKWCQEIRTVQKLVLRQMALLYLLWSEIYSHDPQSSLLNHIGNKQDSKLKSRLSNFTSFWEDISAVSSCGLSFSFELITEDVVVSQHLLLKTNKVIGLDGISACFLKDAAPVISKSLLNLFNSSLTTRLFPSIWKMESHGNF